MLKEGNSPHNSELLRRLLRAISRIRETVRKVTDPVNQDDIQRIIENVALTSEKRTGTSPVTSFSAAVRVTDWRSTEICDIDFGFGKLIAFRRLTSGIHGMTIAVYPRQGYRDIADGIEVDLLVEWKIAQGLSRDRKSYAGLTFWAKGHHNK